MRQSACLVFNPIMVDNYAAFFNFRLYYGPTKSYSFFLVGASCLLLGPPVFNLCFSFAPGFSKLFSAQGSPSGSLLNLLSP